MRQRIQKKAMYLEKYFCESTTLIHEIEQQPPRLFGLTFPSAIPSIGGFCDLEAGWGPEEVVLVGVRSGHPSSP